MEISQISDKTLIEYLAPLLDEMPKNISVLKREPSQRGSFQNEVVTCSFADGSHVRIFCKYELGNMRRGDHHRGGLSHESTIYTHVLDKIDVTTPRYYGAITNGSDTIGIALQEIRDSQRTSHAPYPVAVLRAAEWAGRFHKLTSELAHPSVLSSIDTSRIGYYESLTTNTMQLAHRLRSNDPWIDGLCTRYLEDARTHLTSERSIIHGEYYPTNILFSDGETYPVDWESAAVGAGVIDLAMLTEGWSKDIVSSCVNAYAKSRWKDNRPTSFLKQFRAAQMHTFFRWLGDERVPDSSRRLRFQKLYSHARDLDFL